MELKTLYNRALDYERENSMLYKLVSSEGDVMFHRSEQECSWNEGDDCTNSSSILHFTKMYNMRTSELILNIN